ncbi:hypothetical protein P9112_009949 [Eukaryota sp. TZLM1-RC]
MVGIFTLFDDCNLSLAYLSTVLHLFFTENSTLKVSHPFLAISVSSLSFGVREWYQYPNRLSAILFSLLSATSTDPYPCLNLDLESKVAHRDSNPDGCTY